MFGYVVLSQGATKEEKKTYREFYCGLCRVLKDKFGSAGQLCLSYDMTFLSLLLSDIEDSPITRRDERCMVHPLKKRTSVTTEVMDCTSDMQILISYCNLIDDVSDEDKGKSLLEKIKPFIPEIEKKYPRQVEAAKTCMALLHEEEKNGNKDLDKNALITGNFIGEVFVRDDSNFFAPGLRSVGIELGKFIYIIDAAEDRKSDKRKGLYNPIPEGMTEKEIKDKLLDAASLAASSFEKLPLDDYVSVMSNILYSGIWTKYTGDKKND